MRVRNLMFPLLGIQARVRARSNQDTPSFPQRKQIRFKLWRLFVRSVTSHISFRLCYRSGRSILIPLQGLIMYLRFLKTKTFPFNIISLFKFPHFPLTSSSTPPPHNTRTNTQNQPCLPHQTSSPHTNKTESHTRLPHTKPNPRQSPASHIIHT